MRLNDFESGDYRHARTYVHGEFARKRGELFGGYFVFAAKLEAVEQRAGILAYGSVYYVLGLKLALGFR